MSRAAWQRGSWIAVLTVALVAGLSCARQPAGESGCDCAPSESAPAPVDTALMAFLSKARSVHHQADLREQEQDWSGAAKVLQQLLDTPVPGGKGGAAEANEVLADTHARLAELQGRLGQYEQAEKHIEQGLSLVPALSYFEGHLYEVRGVNAQQQAKALAAQGDSTGAKQQRTRAWDAFEKATAIYDQVIHKTLEPDGGPQEK